MTSPRFFFFANIFCTYQLLYVILQGTIIRYTI